MISSRNAKSVLKAVIAASGLIYHVISAKPALTSPRQLETGSILEVICNTSTLALLCQGVNFSQGLQDLVGGPGPYTVFAPDNTAFGKVDAAYLAELLTPPWAAHLLSLLEYHVVNGTAVNSSALPAAAGTPNVTLDMANGENTTIGYVDPFGPVFITYDNSSAPVYINFTTTDIPASNGIIHTIDAVLPPAWYYVSLTELIPKLAGNYSTIAGLLPIAFPDGIPAIGSLTVLAPTDAAFAKLDPSLIASVKNDSAQLIGLLSNHVLNGVFPTMLLAGLSNVTTLSAITLPITVYPDMLHIGDAMIVDQNLLANDAIVQGIDTVILAAPAPTAPTMMTPTMGSMPAAPTAGGGTAPVAAPTPVAKPAPVPTSSASLPVVMVSFLVAVVSFLSGVFL